MNHPVYDILDSSFIYDSQNLEMTQIPFSGWMDNQTVVHPYIENYSQ